jgi:hypothetical protein
MSLASGLKANVGRMLESNMRCTLIGRAALLVALAMLLLPVSADAQQKNESVGVLGRPPALDTAPSSKAGGGLGPGTGAQDARRIEQRRLQEQQQRRQQQEEQSRWREMLR